MDGSQLLVARESSTLPQDIGEVPDIPGVAGLRIVAAGGFGVVFRGTLVESSHPVVVKLARTDRAGARRRLIEEIRTLEDIGPPTVPAVRGRGTTVKGVPYVLLDDLGKETLAARLTDRAEPMPLLEAVDTAIAIAVALEVLQGRGYVHRDIKPENIFVEGSGHHARAILIDLGLVLGGDPASAAKDEISSEGPIVGTTEYMSPEQCEGRADISGRTDVYAMGVLLHELVTCRPPFWGPRALVQEMHLGHRPSALAARAPDRVIPRMLEDLTACCLAKNPRERFASARDLRRALEAARARIEAGEVTVMPTSKPRLAPAARGERLTVGVTFFTTGAAPPEVQAGVHALGGRLAHAAGGRYAAVFAQEGSDNPARRALLAAKQLLRDGTCTRIRVDLGSAVEQLRRDGTRRFLSPLFGQTDRYPSEADPPLAVTEAAAAVLPEIDDAGQEPDGLGQPYEGGLESSSSWPLVGREGLLADLVAGAARAARESVPGAVAITGDTGTGKSRLFRELRRRLGEVELPVTILAVRAHEPALGDVDRTLLELLAQAPGDAPDEPSRGGVLAAALGRETPRPGGAPAGLAPTLRSLGAAPGALRSAMTLAAGDALRRRAAAQPLLVLLDDAHLAGDVVLSALEYATLAEAGVPIWVCVLGRPALLEAQPTWGERAGRCERRSLDPLDAASAEVLCRALLLPAESVPTSAVQQIVARAEATPLLLVELVRGLHREGLVRRSPKGDSWYLAADELDRLPDLPLVEWIAHRLIDGLSPALRAHARLIALLGDLVTDQEVEGVVRCMDQEGSGDEVPLDPRVATQRLVEADVLARDAEGRCHYHHALVREALAKGAPEAFRRLLHLAAAAHYRNDDRLGEHRRLAQLAVHASAAGLADEAAPAYFLLAERARAWHAYLEAEHLYGRVLSHPGLSDLDQAVAYRGRGVMRYRLSRYHDALADFAIARDLAEQNGEMVAALDILLEEATALDWMDDFVGSELRVREVEARLPPGAFPLLRARLLLGLGRSAMRFSRHDEAVRLLLEAVSAAEVLGDEGYETLVIALLLAGFLLPALCREDEARELLERLIALCEAHGDLLHLGGALNTCALLFARAGDRARMMEDMARSIAIARELGQGSLELMGEFNAGEYLMLMDDPAAAAPHVARALALDLRITGHPGRAVVALLEARLRLFMEDIESAAAIVGALRVRRDEADARGEADGQLVPSDQVLCDAVELAALGGTGEQWDEVEARSARVSFGQERIEIIETRAAAAQRAGRVAEAREHLARALKLAETIPNAMGARLARRSATWGGLPSG